MDEDEIERWTAERLTYELLMRGPGDSDAVGGTEDGSLSADSGHGVRRGGASDGSEPVGVSALQSESGGPVSGSGLRAEVSGRRLASPEALRPDGCICCQGTGEHASGHECYVCDASGLAEGTFGHVCEDEVTKDD